MCVEAERGAVCGAVVCTWEQEDALIVGGKLCTDVIDISKTAEFA